MNTKGQNLDASRFFSLLRQDMSSRFFSLLIRVFMMKEGNKGLMIKLFLRRVGAATIPLGQDRHTAIASGVYTLGLLGILGPDPYTLLAHGNA